MSGRAANHVAGQVIDLADSPPNAQPRKRQRQDGAGAVRNAQRFNGAQGVEQVIDLTHFPEMLDQRRGAAGHVRQPQHYHADSAGLRRDAPDRAHQRVRGPPGGAAPVPAQVPRSPGRARHQAVPPVQFPVPAARAAQGTPKRKPAAVAPSPVAAPPAPQEESAPSCAICLDALKDNLCCAPCGHVFHYKCLKDSIVKFKYCPTCRKPIKSEKTIKKIFL